MTKLLQHAVDRARRLSPDMQDEIARMVLGYAGEDEGPINLTADEDAAISTSRAAAARGDFATYDEVDAVWARHGL